MGSVESMPMRNDAERFGKEGMDKKPLRPGYLRRGAANGGYDEKEMPPAPSHVKPRFPDNNPQFEQEKHLQEMLAEISSLGEEDAYKVLGACLQRLDNKKKTVTGFAREGNFEDSDLIVEKIRSARTLKEAVDIMLSFGDRGERRKYEKIGIEPGDGSVVYIKKESEMAEKFKALIEAGEDDDYALIEGKRKIMGESYGEIGGMFYHFASKEKYTVEQIRRGKVFRVLNLLERTKKLEDIANIMDAFSVESEDIWQKGVKWDKETGQLLIRKDSDVAKNLAGVIATGGDNEYHLDVFPDKQKKYFFSSTSGEFYRFVPNKKQPEISQEESNSDNNFWDMAA